MILTGQRLHGLALLWIVTACACSHGPTRELRRASRALGKDIARGDPHKVRAHVVPGSAAAVDTQQLQEEPAQQAWAKALAKPQELQAGARLMVAPQLWVRAVWTDKGWRFAEDPTDIYAQDTPQRALRALVLASQNARWDVLISLAPQRYRVGLSEADLEQAWTQGEQAKVLTAARDEIAAHLADPISADAHEAVLEIGAAHTVRLEREGERWVVVDFLPISPEPPAMPARHD